MLNTSPDIIWGIQPAIFIQYNCRRNSTPITKRSIVYFLCGKLSLNVAMEWFYTSKQLPAGLVRSIIMEDVCTLIYSASFITGTLFPDLKSFESSLFRCFQLSFSWGLLLASSATYFCSKREKEVSPVNVLHTDDGVSFSQLYY